MFIGESNPFAVENVDVVTGFFHLHMEDERILGPVTIPIIRTYSSKDEAVVGENKSDWKTLSEMLPFGSGWNLLPHLEMLIDPRHGESGYEHHLKIYLSEPNGSLISYVFSHMDGKDQIVLKSTCVGGQGFGVLSGLTNPKNHKIELRFKKGEAIVHLANGGYRIYRGEYFPVRDTLKNLAIPLSKRKLRYYRLEEERLPSGQYILYKYQEVGNLLTITLFDSKKEGRYGQVDIVAEESDTWIFSEKGKAAHYSFSSDKWGKYLEKVDRAGLVEESFSYKKGKKGKGPLLESITRGGIEELFIHYDPSGRVERVERPVGTVAMFSYETDTTEVRDIQNRLTRYLHKDGRVYSIEYFDEKERLVSIQKFFWEDGYLIGKALCNEKGEGSFSKTFLYDDFGNVIEENLYGNLSGECPGPFTLDLSGKLEGAEEYKKSYRYDEKTHLLVEEGDKGLIYRYCYKEGCDLLTSKETYSFEGILLMREGYAYDDRNLLIGKITDDGYRIEEVRFENDPSTGLCSGFYEQGIKRVKYYRNLYGQIVKEALYDGDDHHCYTLYTDYDIVGRVLRKTTPSGLENSYTYDPFGNLIESKEVGSPRKFFTYDEMHRCVHAKELEKVSTILYDLKGNVEVERDFKGLTSLYTYDAFNRNIRKTIPEMSIFLSYEHDIQGNIVKERSPKGYETKKRYTTFQKPYFIETPDGAVTKHTYTLSGLLKSTLLPDHTKITYEYDLLDRMIAKKISDAEGRVLSHEQWRYHGAKLDSYREKSGLETHYSYDSFGRLVKEDRGGRVKSYAYDHLGFLESVTTGDITHTKIHDEEGRVVEEFTGLEDHRLYIYNKENQKIEAITKTSHGDAWDIFSYDPVGRVSFHKAPDGGVTHILYDELSKTVIDPLGNSKIERYDPLYRVIEIEKRDPQGNTTFLEDFSYDTEGNKVRHRSAVYAKGGIDRVIELSFLFDPMGRVILQTEEGDRRRSYKYDLRGRNIVEVKPDGVSISKTYDALDRITSLRSRDGSIFYEYIYEGGDAPVEIKDRASNRSLTFTYNVFSEPIREGKIVREYDDLGQLSLITLPDLSSIQYGYEKGHMRSVGRVTPTGAVAYEHRYTKFDLNGHVEEEEMIGGLGFAKSRRDLLERSIEIHSPYGKEEIFYDLAGFVTCKQNSLLGAKEYGYDPLYQMIYDGERHYEYDSLGNQVGDEIDEYNQLLTRGNDHFEYDLNGNLTYENREGEIRKYSYDLLDRLISIEIPDEKRVNFEYDPLGRLYSKEVFTKSWGWWRLAEKRGYLYDGEVEIGSFDENGNIVELRVLGLGLKGEVGGAVALEIGGKLYAPIQDFGGNLIAIIDVEKKEIEEIYEIDPFGRECQDSYISPWRFCSKRGEEGLFFFGSRFHHPEIGRWLTPDPLGFKESRNPYLFVLNNPINRLDLFGLESVFKFYIDDSHRDRYYGYLMETPALIPDKFIGLQNVRTETNVIVIHDKGHYLHFSEQEIAAGQFDLSNHMHELVPPEGQSVGLAFYGNGINTDATCWRDTCRTIDFLLPQESLLISLHNPTDGLFKDLYRVSQTFRGKENKRIEALREVHIALLKEVDNVNKKASVLNFAYSEGGLNYFSAFDGMNRDDKDLVRDHLLVNTIGAPQFSPKSFGKECINYFSDRDYIAKIPGRKYMNNPDYDIREVHCISKRSQMLAGCIDHGILAPTYMDVMKTVINDVEGRYGFYKRANR